MGLVFSAQRDPENAVLVLREAVELRRWLATAEPAAFADVLAGSLEQLARALSELGHPDQAAAAAEEAAAIRA